MRVSLSFSILIVLEFIIHTNASGQNASATGSARAMIVQTINISKVRDMNFGRIAAGATAGTVILSPAEAGTRTASGGVTFPPGSGSVGSAKFIISGADGHSFSIILPAAPVRLSNGTSFMTIDNFTSIPSGSGTFTPGSQSICVGATLNVGANQEAGVYETEEDFEVTINYN